MLSRLVQACLPVIAFACICSTAVVSAQNPTPLADASDKSAPLPPIQPANRKVIGVALEGGGALGMAHIGILEWMEENHIPVDRLSGTSMGSLIGALYASGHTPAQIHALATGDTMAEVFSLRTAYADSSYRRRQDRRELPQGISIGLKDGPQVRNALFASRGIDEFLQVQFFAYNSQNLDYNAMPVPFRCVATDITTFGSVIFRSGSLSEAVRASISIPGIFPPVQDARGHFLVDGGIVNNLPTDVLRKDLHAEVVIAVRLEDAPLSASDTQSIIGVLNRAFSVGIVHNVDAAEKLADIVVRVPVGSFSAMDYGKAKELIDVGYKAAEANRTALIPYALNEQDWDAYMTARNARLRPQPGMLQAVRVEGSSHAARKNVQAEMKPLKDKPMTAVNLQHALTPVQSNGGIAARYETFAATSANAALPDQVGHSGVPDTGVMVRLSDDAIGPPYLMIGPEFAASTSNVFHTTIRFRVVDQNLGGFGSELRAGGHFGYSTNLWAEYYRQFSPRGYFIEPRVGALREPVYIWDNQKRVAERFQQSIDAGIVVGRTFTPELQVSAEWRAIDTHWRLTTGSGGGPYLSGTAQTGYVQVYYDHANASAVSVNGLKLELAVGALYHAAQSENAPMVKFAIARNWSPNNKNILNIGLDVNSYMRTNVAQPYRFTLGGPLRLSASSFDEYRGTDTVLLRAGYLHRVASLPTGVGQGLYAAFGYEGGEVWSPESRAILRQDGVLGLLANTPIGVITFGGSVGDAGRRKVFITFGRLF